MSRIKVDRITDKAGTGAPTLVNGMNVTGQSTMNNIVGAAVTFNSITGDVTGNLTGNVTGNVAGDVTGSGANLTNLPAGQLTGTVADARISTLTASKLTGALPAISGANLTNLPPGGNTVSLVADGAIAAGKPCIIQTDGKTKQLGVVYSNPGSAPQNSTENSGSDQSYFGLAWSPQRNRLIIAQSKESGNKQSSAKICTPSLSFSVNGMTLGTDQPFDTSDVEWTDCAYDPDTNQTIFVWEDMGSSSYGKCVLGTLSGGSYDQMTYGTVVTFESNFAIDSCKVVYDTTNDKVVVIYRRTSTGYIFARVGTVSGTNISFGSSFVLAGGSAGTDPGGIDACFAGGSTNRVVVVFHNAASGGGNKGNTVALEVSGTSITWGTPVSHNGNGATHHNRCCFDENQGKVVVAFRNDANNGIGYAIIPTISGNTVSFLGGPTAFPSSIQCGGQGICYDPSSKDIFIFCAASNSSNHGRIIRGTVNTNNGGEITLPYATTLTGGQDPMYSDNKNWDLIAVNTGNSDGDGAVAKIVGVCRQQNTTNLKIYTFKTQTSTTNGNCNNIIGWSAAAYTDGQTATLNTVGNVIDNQSGLTPGTDYYIQGDGSLAVSWDSSAFGSCATNANFGGTAIAADKLLIRDINAKF